MDSGSYRELDREVLWHPYTDYQELMSEDFPIIERAKGIYLFDVDGKKYLDAISSWWACNLGHGDEEIIEAIRNQSSRLQHSILGNQSHPGAVQLAERLVELTGGERKVHYGSDGASAVEIALKIALQYWHNSGRPEKKNIAYLAGDYHGDTTGALSVGYLPKFHKPFREFVNPQPAVKGPDCFNCPENSTPVNCNLSCYQPAKEFLDKYSSQLAGFIVEPLCQAASGINIYPARFLCRLAADCLHNDVLLIDDEIAMGFGRTGKFWAYQHADIEPDIICVGKGLTGGYLPLSAALVKNRIFSAFKSPPAFRTFFHGHTFAGNPIAAAAGLANLDRFVELKILQKIAGLSDLIERELKVLGDLDTVRGVRTLGMIGAVYLDSSSGSSAVNRAVKIKRLLRDQGVLIRPLGSVVYLMPPLIIKPTQLIGLLELFVEAVKQTA